MQFQHEMDWSAGTWTHQPVRFEQDDGDFLVEAKEGSDAWRETSYGFVHASEHALVAPLQIGEAMETTFLVDLPCQFDQAGLFVRVDESCWVKAGVERSDGILELGSVVTKGFSDWAVCPVNDWSGAMVTMRVSRMDDCLIIRARKNADPFQFVRVTPLAAGAVATAGPYVCAPTRPGLCVRFTSWNVGKADAALHGEASA